MTTLVIRLGCGRPDHRRRPPDGHRPALAGYVGSGNDSVDVVTAGASVYVGSPALSSVTGGTTWLKAALPKDATSANADSSTLAVLADPSQLLGLLSSVGGQVTTVGNVDLHGVPTTEYRTTVTAVRAGRPGRPDRPAPQLGAAGRPGAAASSAPPRCR